MARTTTPPKPPATPAARGGKKPRTATTTRKPNYGKRAARAGVHAATALATGTAIQTLDGLGYEKEATIATGVLAAGGLIAQIASDGEVAAVLGTAGNAALAVGGGRAISREIVKRTDRGRADRSAFDEDWDPSFDYERERERVPANGAAAAHGYHD